MKKAIIRSKDGQELPGLKFHLLDGFTDELMHVVFTRHGGYSKAPYNSLNLGFAANDKMEDVKKNRRKVLEVCNLEAIVSPWQTHSDNVLVLNQENYALHSFDYKNPERETHNFDAVITASKDQAIMLKVADCQVIIFFDPSKKVLGLAHAGWKGLAKDISGKTIKAMVENFGCNPAHIIAGISPSLSTEHTEFSDPFNELPVDFHPFIVSKKGKYFVDLWSFSKWQLEEHGLLSEKIELARICTFGDVANRFYSYRKDQGETGRFGVLAYLK